VVRKIVFAGDNSIGECIIPTHFRFFCVRCHKQLRIEALSSMTHNGSFLVWNRKNPEEVLVLSRDLSVASFAKVND